MPSEGHLRKEALGYQLHTNRELGMMLCGSKPLAVFSEVHGAFPEPVVRYLRLFDRHVETGRLVKRRHLEKARAPHSGNTYELSVVLYAQPDEVWRIDAMIDLRRNLGVWTAEHERTEGSLLGYTDWQNDRWLANQIGQD